MSGSNNNQQGGPWGGGGGKGRPKNPWGSPKRQPPRRKRGSSDLNGALDGIRGIFRNGGPGSGRILLVGAGLVLLWALSGIYQVKPDEQGVVLRFGKYVGTTNPGLHYRLPTPIEAVYKPKVTKVHQENIGFEERRGSVRDVQAQSLMLTGDENIVDIDFSVFWQIKSGPDYLFNLDEPIEALRAVAESAMREVIGRSELQPIISEGRAEVENQALELIQRTMDEYQSGIQVNQVQLQDADPPGQVIDAFKDVASAEQDRTTAINEAVAFANAVVPKARGEAERLVKEAEAYQESVIADAEGEAARFRLIYDEYRKAPRVTRERMYYETLEKVLGRSNKIILDDEAGQGVVPYLPLNELTKRGDTP